MKGFFTYGRRGLGQPGGLKRDSLQTGGPGTARKPYEGILSIRGRPPEDGFWDLFPGPPEDPSEDPLWDPFPGPPEEPA